ncbi:MAG TPA: shikimate dehydrogenase [Acidimicrobiales bacterium]|nr:shikimate dehydrogenase [Acidimicrobiales bacterium]
MATPPAVPESMVAESVAKLGLSAASAVVGVIGDPVAHSLSPRLHNVAFAQLGLDWVSVGFRVVDGDAAAALLGARSLGIRGLSVTMPHKAAVAAHVDRLTGMAERVGAVNCVTNVDGVLTGDNTDGRGLVEALRRGGHFDPDGRRCLVVGAGGAARSVIAALADAGAAEVVVVNRTPERAVAAAALAGSVGRVGGPEAVGDADLVVNATPTGMAGTSAPPGPEGLDRWALDPARLGPGQLAVDLVYHPAITPWLEAARGRGAQVLNGLGMLVHQAALQLETWTGQEPPVDAMWRAIGEFASE